MQNQPIELISFGFSDRSV